LFDDERGGAVVVEDEGQAEVELHFAAIGCGRDVRAWLPGAEMPGPGVQPPEAHDGGEESENADADCYPSHATEPMLLSLMVATISSVIRTGSVVVVVVSTVSVVALVEHPVSTGSVVQRRGGAFSLQSTVFTGR
jgi:hypothetical protein